MRVCPQCQIPLRYDESLSLVQTERGIFYVCAYCQAKELGTVPPEPRRYHPGAFVPSHPGRGHLPICGLCRLALREGDRTVPVRLHREDAADTPFAEHIEDGDLYAVCAECLSLFRPRVVARLRAVGIISQKIPEQQVRGYALM